MEREVFMERIYRGYPQAVWEQQTVQSMGNSVVQDMGTGMMRDAERMPYMLYNREQQQEWTEAWSDKRRRRAEQEYFKGLYPMSVRRCQRFVEAECDRCDKPGNPMYDEYPDREQLYRMRERILKNAEEMGFREDRDLVMLLLLNEIDRRRAEKG